MRNDDHLGRVWRRCDHDVARRKNFVDVSAAATAQLSFTGGEARKRWTRYKSGWRPSNGGHSSSAGAVRAFSLLVALFMRRVALPGKLSKKAMLQVRQRTVKRRKREPAPATSGHEERPEKIDLLLAPARSRTFGSRSGSWNCAHKRGLPKKTRRDIFTVCLSASRRAVYKYISGAFHLSPLYVLLRARRAFRCRGDARSSPPAIGALTARAPADFDGPRNARRPRAANEEKGTPDCRVRGPDS